mmetsp:Transcript_54880/g.146524  ORF Transcript_54880/g.146524 Transcript_54880/m.146524 type:complete len:201 (-) Transcript_54880:109-711(-)
MTLCTFEADARFDTGTGCTVCCIAELSTAGGAELCMVGDMASSGMAGAEDVYGIRITGSAAFCGLETVGVKGLPRRAVWRGSGLRCSKGSLGLRIVPGFAWSPSCACTRCGAPIKVSNGTGPSGRKVGHSRVCDLRTACFGSSRVARYSTAVAAGRKPNGGECASSVAGGSFAASASAAARKYTPANSAGRAAASAARVA